MLPAVAYEGSDGLDTISRSFMYVFNQPWTTLEVSMSWSQSVGSFLIHLTTLFIIGLVAAFVISFYFSASTIIYALMRDGVDNVGTDEIYIQLDELRDDVSASNVREED